MKKLAIAAVVAFAPISLNAAEACSFEKYEVKAEGEKDSDEESINDDDRGREKDVLAEGEQDDSDDDAINDDDR